MRSRSITGNCPVRDGKVYPNVGKLFRFFPTAVLFPTAFRLTLGAASISLHRHHPPLDSELPQNRSQAGAIVPSLFSVKAKILAISIFRDARQCSPAPECAPPGMPDSSSSASGPTASGMSTGLRPPRGPPGPAGRSIPGPPPPRPSASGTLDLLRGLQPCRTRLLMRLHSPAASLRGTPDASLRRAPFLAWACPCR